jgi:hypothetical protein
MAVGYGGMKVDQMCRLQDLTLILRRLYTRGSQAGRVFCRDVLTFTDPKCSAESSRASPGLLWSVRLGCDPQCPHEARIAHVPGHDDSQFNDFLR